MFHDSLKITSVLFLIADFNLLALHLNYWIELFYIDIILNQNVIIVEHIYKPFTVPCEKLKFPRSNFTVKLTCYIALGLAS